MKKVSIIIPVYNTEKHLPDCLDSLINQTLNEIEIILVNDGSTDGSQAVINEYQNKYPEKIKSAYQENAGVSAARNRGIKMATGKYVSFVDSDDFMELNSYELLYEYAEKNELEVLGFSFNEVRDGAVIPAVPIFPLLPALERLMVEQAMVTNKLFNREFLINNNLAFTEGIYYEDLEFIPRAIAKVKKGDWVDLHLYNYYTRQSSIMHQAKLSPKAYDIFLVLENLEKALGDFPEEMEYLYVEHLLFSAATRFICFKERRGLIKRLADVVRQKFPNWKNNRYFKKRNIKYRLFCFATYHKSVFALMLFAKLRSIL